MKRHVTFPHIDLFRTLVETIKHNSTYIGKDEQGEFLYDETLPKPVLTFEGTVKLHGSLVGCNYDLDSHEIYAQSKENLLEPTKYADNYGFAKFVEQNEVSFRKLFEEMIDRNCSLNYEGQTLTIFGEWVGSGIQNKVAIVNLEKSFFIFGVKVSSPDTDFKSYWLPFEGLCDPQNRIFNIKDFPTYPVTIDFNKPAEYLEELNNLVTEVENKCPVAKQFGIEGTGEGIVFTTVWRGENYRFKAKGEAHKSSKQSDKIQIEPERLNSILEFVNYGVTENRFNQCIEIVFKNQIPTIKRIGEVMRWMNEDILREEQDVLAVNELQFKDVNKYVSNRVKTMFFTLLDTVMI